MKKEIVLKVKQTEESKRKGLPLPAYTRRGDAGIDLRSARDIIVRRGERKLVPAGIHIAIPQGFVGIIKDRSGLAAREGVHTLAGVIDANYRGEVKVVILNTGERDFFIKTGDRIAQLLVFPIPVIRLEEGELEDTERGYRGFGSSGKG